MEEHIRDLIKTKKELHRIKKKSELSKTESEKLERREKVKHLRMIGVSNVQMAEQFGVDEKTIRNDLKVIEKDIIKEISEADRNLIVGKLKRHTDKVLERAWSKHYSKEMSGKEKLDALRITLDAVNRQQKILEGIGLVKPTTEAGTPQGDIIIWQQIANIYQEIKKEEIETDK